MLVMLKKKSSSVLLAQFLAFLISFSSLSRTFPFICHNVVYLNIFKTVIVIIFIVFINFRLFYMLHTFLGSLPLPSHSYRLGLWFTGFAVFIVYFFILMRSSSSSPFISYSNLPANYIIFSTFSSFSSTLTVLTSAF